MNLRDAAQQALEALRIAQDDCIHGEMAEPSPIFEKVITALEAALAEPQPEIEQLKAERDALLAAAEKGTEYVLAHINQDLRAERDALLEAIQNHNAVLQNACGNGEQEAVRCQYRPYFVASGRRCPDCPTYCMIDIDAAIDAARSKP